MKDDEETDVIEVAVLKTYEGWQTFWLMVAPGLADRIYTSNPAEIESLLGIRWAFGGEAFRLSRTDPSNNYPLHRFVLPNGRHLWTANQDEANGLLATSNTGYEGIVGYVGTGGVQVRRLYGAPDHILTTKPDENPTGYKFEGIAFGCGVAVAATIPADYEQIKTALSSAQAIIAKVKAAVV